MERLALNIYWRKQLPRMRKEQPRQPEPSREFMAHLKQLGLNVAMNEDNSSKYVPDDTEIREYAEFLGFDLPEDEDLLWLAKEGLQAPLPTGWKPYLNNSENIVFVNIEKELVEVDHPLDELYRNKYVQQKAKKEKRMVQLEDEDALPAIEQEESEMTKTLTGQEQFQLRRQDDIDSLGASMKKMTSSDFIPAKHPQAYAPVHRLDYASPKHDLVTEQSEEGQLDLIEEINAKMSQAYSNKIKAELDNIDLPTPASLPRPNAVQIEKAQEEVQGLLHELASKQRLLEELTRERIAKQKQLLDMEMEFQSKKQKIVDSYRSRLKKQLESSKTRKKKELQEKADALKKRQLAMLNN